MIRSLHFKFLFFLTALIAISFSGLAQLSIVEILPKNKSINISTKISLEITFNKEVYAGKGSIHVYTDGNEIMEIYANDALVTYNEVQVIIDLPEELKSNTKYYINIDDDAFQSTSREYFKGLYSSTNWLFTTALKSNSGELYSKREPSFYPNPATSEIWLTNMEEVESLHISNLTGRYIMEVKSPDTSISLSNIPKGMYFITFVSFDGSKVTKKLLKH